MTTINKLIRDLTDEVEIMHPAFHKLIDDREIRQFVVETIVRAYDRRRNEEQEGDEL